MTTQGDLRRAIERLERAAIARGGATGDAITKELEAARSHLLEVASRRVAIKRAAALARGEQSR